MPAIDRPLADCIVYTWRRLIDLSLIAGGAGMNDPQVLESHLAILTELSTEYDTDGVELDLSSGPGRSMFCIKLKILQ